MFIHLKLASGEIVELERAQIFWGFGLHRALVGLGPGKIRLSGTKVIMAIDY